VYVSDYRVSDRWEKVCGGGVVSDYIVSDREKDCVWGGGERVGWQG
jgi:hypothetical protein